MQRIALIKVSPGMTLAQAVCRSDGGAVLIGEGHVLTESVIKRIRAAGVNSIWVEGNPLGPGGDVGNIRAVAAALPFLFRRHTDNVFMMTLCSVFSRHFARKLAAQQALEDARLARERGAAAGDPADKTGAGT